MNFQSRTFKHSDTVICETDSFPILGWFTSTSVGIPFTLFRSFFSFSCCRISFFAHFYPRAMQQRDNAKWAIENEWDGSITADMRSVKIYSRLYFNTCSNLSSFLANFLWFLVDLNISAFQFVFFFAFAILYFCQWTLFLLISINTHHVTIDAALLSGLHAQKNVLTQSSSNVCFYFCTRENDVDALNQNLQIPNEHIRYKVHYSSPISTP